MVDVPVELGERRYVISVGRGLTRDLARILAPLRGRRLAVVSSPRVWAAHGARLLRGLRGMGPVTRVLMPDGERAKTRRTLAAVQDAFADAGLARDAVVIAFGGGVVGDLAGFAAATWMRGVDLVQVPTTLLAMVDSAIGGKVGVNHPRAKNLLGAFHQPKAVVADVDLLATLPPRELQSGAYEVLKCAVIGDRPLFEALAAGPGRVPQWPAGLLEAAVAGAAALKARVVAADEREGGLRRVLNLGHTVGHALESATGYRRFRHGEAVGWGMHSAVALAGARGLLAADAARTIAAEIDRLGPRPPLGDIAVADILAALAHDKKKRDGRIPFILPTAVGAVTIVDDVDSGEIRSALRSLAATSAAWPAAAAAPPSARAGGSRPRRTPPTAGRR